MTPIERWRGMVDDQTVVAAQIDRDDGRDDGYVVEAANGAHVGLDAAWRALTEPLDNEEWLAAYQIVNDALQRWSRRAFWRGTLDGIEAVRAGGAAAIDRAPSLSSP